MFKKLIKRYLKFSKDKRGFTLLEMLLVLIILAILMAIIIPNVSGQKKRINEQAAEDIREIVQTQANTYQLVENDDSVSLDVLLSEGYITQKQKNEAEKFLEVQTIGSDEIQIKAEYQKH